MNSMTDDELDAMIEEGADLIDEIVEKNSKGKNAASPAGDASVLVAFVQSKSLFRDAAPALIQKAAAQVSELEGMSPAEMAEALKSDPDLMSTYTRALAHLIDEAEAHPKEDEDGRAEPVTAAPDDAGAPVPGAGPAA